MLRYLEQYTNRQTHTKDMCGFIGMLPTSSVAATIRQDIT